MASLAFRLLAAALLLALSLALPQLSSAQDIEVSKSRINAQNIAAVADAALAAGYDGSNWKTISDVISSLETGLTVSVGGGDPMTFKVPGLSTEERAAVLPYLTLTTSPSVSLSYHPDPSP